MTQLLATSKKERRRSRRQKFAARKLLTKMIKKLTLGINHRKTGAASQSFPQGFENQRGITRGNFEVLSQIKSAEKIAKEKLIKAAETLKRRALCNLVNSHIFIESKKIIPGRDYLLKFREFSSLAFFDQYVLGRIR